MISIVEKSACCGCNACGDICPKDAITFSPDSEGFLYPQVNQLQCVQCGLCDNVCPMKLARTNDDAPKSEAYAAIHSNLEIRFDSTSGGVLSALAQSVYDQRGFVGGAIWDKDFSIRQVVSEHAEDLPRIRSSKYAQSNATGFYRAVRDAVKTGRPVLLCGTPCQMSAVHTFLKGKIYDNLILVDFICRGINSPSILRKYLDMFEEEVGAKVVAVKQKSKELGWRRLTTKLTFANGAVRYDPRETSRFMRGYLQSNMYSRPSCYSCAFKGFPKIADLTLADCWGAVEALPKEFDENLGTSLILCNTPKGVRILQGLRNIIKMEPLQWDPVLRGNPMLMTSLAHPKKDRATYYALLREKGFKDASDYLFDDSTPHRATIRGTAKKIKAQLSYIGSHWKSILAWCKLNSLKIPFTLHPTLKPTGNVVISKHKTASVHASSDTYFGKSIHFPSSQLESRLLLHHHTTLTVHGGAISYGADVELFPNAHLEIGSGFYANIGSSIVCAERITIGNDVFLGRNVTIRDTHGGHMINRAGFKTNAPVHIEDHVWLCEGCTVMPGVTIGAGAIVAAHAIVTHNVPPNSLVAGIPAKVIRTGIQWKA